MSNPSPDKNKRTQMRTKKELIEALAERTQQSKIDTDLPGIGKFTVKKKQARTGRNPATGEPIQIAAKKFPAFSAAKALKDAVDQG
jgi:DNA-binding protein HU-beta